MIEDGMVKEDGSIGEGRSIDGDVSADVDVFWEEEESWSSIAFGEEMGSVCGEVMGLSERLG